MLEDNPNLQQVEKPRNKISKSVSEASKILLIPLSDSQQSNIPSTQRKAQNRLNFITLENISEQKRIKIINTGFQHQVEGKISLKKYY